MLQASCISFFTVEFLLRFASSPKKLLFLREPMNVVSSWVQNTQFCFKSQTPTQKKSERKCDQLTTPDLPKDSPGGQGGRGLAIPNNHHPPCQIDLLAIVPYYLHLFLLSPAGDEAIQLGSLRKIMQVPRSRIILVQ